jgi:hypothetical protein
LNETTIWDNVSNLGIKSRGGQVYHLKDDVTVYIIKLKYFDVRYGKSDPEISNKGHCMLVGRG